jgi:hypothetical protein
LVTSNSQQEEIDMRNSARCAIVLLAVSAGAAEMDPRLLRLIGPDAKYVSGGDVERYRVTKVAQLMSPGLDSEPQSLRFRLEIGLSDRRTLYVTVDDAMGAPEGDGVDEQPRNYRGARIWTVRETQSHALVGQGVVLYGDTKTVTEAIDRWAGQTAPLTELAVAARRLASSYDVWTVMAKPLDHAEFEGAPPRSQRMRELSEAIVQMRAGARFGSVTEAVAELDCKSSDDAIAIATLAKYLPVLLESRGDLPGMAIELADHITTRAQGSTAMITLSVDERKLDEMLQERKKQLLELSRVM